MLATPIAIAGTFVTGRVTRAISGFFEIETSVGPRVAALRSALRNSPDAIFVESQGRTRPRSETLEPVVVGDFVRLRLVEEEAGRDWIEEVMPRTGQLARRAAGERRLVGQTLVANVDQIILVFAASRPQPKAGLVDRFLVATEAQELPAILCLNKIDLNPDPETVETFSEFARIGYPVLRLSAKYGSDVELLRRHLADRTSALVGPSGVGKSSLLNSIEPGLGLRVSATSVATGKGRHTTRFAQLLPLSFGGFVVDTPGLKEFALWSVHPNDLGWCFPEFRPWLDSCRFGDCDHVKADDCAVLNAIGRGAISRRRHESYVTLLAESSAEQDMRRGRAQRRANR